MWLSQKKKSLRDMDQLELLPYFLVALWINIELMLEAIQVDINPSIDFLILLRLTSTDKKEAVH